MEDAQIEHAFSTKRTHHHAGLPLFRATHQGMEPGAKSERDNQPKLRLTMDL